MVINGGVLNSSILKFDKGHGFRTEQQIRTEKNKLLNIVTLPLQIPGLLANAGTWLVSKPLILGYKLLKKVHITDVVSKFWQAQLVPTKKGKKSLRDFATALEYKILGFNTGAITEEQVIDAIKAGTRWAMTLDVLPTMIATLPITSYLNPSMLYKALRSSNMFLSTWPLVQKRIVEYYKVLKPRIKSRDFSNLSEHEKEALRSLSAISISGPLFYFFEMGWGQVVPEELEHLNMVLMADIGLFGFVGQAQQKIREKQRQGEDVPETKAFKLLEAVEEGITYAFAVSSLSNWGRLLNSHRNLQNIDNADNNVYESQLQTVNELDKPINVVTNIEKLDGKDIRSNSKDLDFTLPSKVDDKLLVDPIKHSELIKDMVKAELFAGDYKISDYLDKSLVLDKVLDKVVEYLQSQSTDMVDYKQLANYIKHNFIVEVPTNRSMKDVLNSMNIKYNDNIQNYVRDGNSVNIEVFAQTKNGDIKTMTTEDWNSDNYGGSKPLFMIVAPKDDTALTNKVLKDIKEGKVNPNITEPPTPGKDKEVPWGRVIETGDGAVLGKVVFNKDHYEVNLTLEGGETFINKAAQLFSTLNIESNAKRQLLGNSTTTINSYGLVMELIDKGYVYKVDGVDISQDPLTLDDFRQLSAGVVLRIILPATDKSKFIKDVANVIEDIEILRNSNISSTGYISAGQKVSTLNFNGQQFSRNELDNFLQQLKQQGGMDASLEIIKGNQVLEIGKSKEMAKMVFSENKGQILLAEVLSNWDIYKKDLTMTKMLEIVQMLSRDGYVTPDVYKMLEQEVIKHNRLSSLQQLSSYELVGLLDKAGLLKDAGNSNFESLQKLQYLKGVSQVRFVGGDKYITIILDTTTHERVILNVKLSDIYGSSLLQEKADVELELLLSRLLSDKLGFTSSLHEYFSKGLSNPEVAYNILDNYFHVKHDILTDIDFSTNPLVVYKTIETDQGMIGQQQIIYKSKTAGSYTITLAESDVDIEINRDKSAYFENTSSIKDLSALKFVRFPLNYPFVSKAIKDYSTRQALIRRLEIEGRIDPAKIGQVMFLDDTEKAVIIDDVYYPDGRKATGDEILVITSQTWWQNNISDFLYGYSGREKLAMTIPNLINKTVGSNRQHTVFHGTAHLAIDPDEVTEAIKSMFNLPTDQSLTNIFIQDDGRITSKDGKPIVINGFKLEKIMPSDLMSSVSMGNNKSNSIENIRVYKLKNRFSVIAVKETDSVHIKYYKDEQGVEHVSLVNDPHLSKGEIWEINDSSMLLDAFVKVQQVDKNYLLIRNQDGAYIANAVDHDINPSWQKWFRMIHGQDEYFNLYKLQSYIRGDDGVLYRLGTSQNMDTALAQAGKAVKSLGLDTNSLFYKALAQKDSQALRNYLLNYVKGYQILEEIKEPVDIDLNSNKPNLRVVINGHEHFINVLEKNGTTVFDNKGRLVFQDSRNGIFYVKQNDKLVKISEQDVRDDTFSYVLNQQNELLLMPDGSPVLYKNGDYFYIDKDGKLIKTYNIISLVQKINFRTSKIAGDGLKNYLTIDIQTVRDSSYKVLSSGLEVPDNEKSNVLYNVWGVLSHHALQVVVNPADQKSLLLKGITDNGKEKVVVYSNYLDNNGRPVYQDKDGQFYVLHNKKLVELKGQVMAFDTWLKDHDISVLQYNGDLIYDNFTGLPVLVDNHFEKAYVLGPNGLITVTGDVSKALKLKFLSRSKDLHSVFSQGYQSPDTIALLADKYKEVNKPQNIWDKAGLRVKHVLNKLVPDWLQFMLDGKKEFLYTISEWPIKILETVLGKHYTKIVQDLESLVEQDMQSTTLYNPYIAKALVAQEQHRFFIDNKENLDAITLFGMLSGYVKGDSIRGGSTITQHLVKSYMDELARDRRNITSNKIERKLIEWGVAGVLREKFPERGLINLTLDRLDFGFAGGIGVEKASEVFFGERDVNKLDVGRSAILIASINQPYKYGPLHFLTNNTDVRSTDAISMAIGTLQKEQALGLITHEEFRLGVKKVHDFYRGAFDEQVKLLEQLYPNKNFKQAIQMYQQNQPDKDLISVLEENGLITSNEADKLYAVIVQQRRDDIYARLQTTWVNTKENNAVLDVKISDYFETHKPKILQLLQLKGDTNPELSYYVLFDLVVEFEKQVGHSITMKEYHSFINWVKTLQIDNKIKSVLDVESEVFSEIVLQSDKGILVRHPLSYVLSKDGQTAFYISSDGSLVYDTGIEHLNVVDDGIVTVANNTDGSVAFKEGDNLVVNSDIKLAEINGHSTMVRIYGGGKLKGYIEDLETGLLYKVDASREYELVGIKDSNFNVLQLNKEKLYDEGIRKIVFEQLNKQLTTVSTSSNSQFLGLIQIRGDINQLKGKIIVPFGMVSKDVLAGKNSETVINNAFVVSDILDTDNGIRIIIQNIHNGRVVAITPSELEYWQRDGYFVSLGTLDKQAKNVRFTSQEITDQQKLTQLLTWETEKYQALQQSNNLFSVNDKLESQLVKYYDQEKQNGREVILAFGFDKGNGTIELIGATPNLDTQFLPGSAFKVFTGYIAEVAGINWVPMDGVFVRLHGVPVQNWTYGRWNDPKDPRNVAPTIHDMLRLSNNPAAASLFDVAMNKLEKEKGEYWLDIVEDYLPTDATGKPLASLVSTGHPAERVYAAFGQTLPMHPVGLLTLADSIFYDKGEVVNVSVGGDLVIGKFEIPADTREIKEGMYGAANDTHGTATYLVRPFKNTVNRIFTDAHTNFELTNVYIKTATAEVGNDHVNYGVIGAFEVQDKTTGDIIRIPFVSYDLNTETKEDNSALQMVLNNFEQMVRDDPSLSWVQPKQIQLAPQQVVVTQPNYVNTQEVASVQNLESDEGEANNKEQNIDSGQEQVAETSIQDSLQIEQVAAMEQTGVPGNNLEKGDMFVSDKEIKITNPLVTAGSISKVAHSDLVDNVFAKYNWLFNSKNKTQCVVGVLFAPSVVKDNDKYLIEKAVDPQQVIKYTEYFLPNLSSGAGKLPYQLLGVKPDENGNYSARQIVDKSYVVARGWEGHRLNDIVSTGKLSDLMEKMVYSGQPLFLIRQADKLAGDPDGHVVIMFPIKEGDKQYIVILDQNRQNKGDIRLVKIPYDEIDQNINKIKSYIEQFANTKDDSKIWIFNHGTIYQYASR